MCPHSITGGSICGGTTFFSRGPSIGNFTKTWIKSEKGAKFIRKKNQYKKKKNQSFREGLAKVSEGPIAYPLFFAVNENWVGIFAIDLGRGKLVNYQKPVSPLMALAGRKFPAKNRFGLGPVNTGATGLPILMEKKGFSSRFCKGKRAGASGYWKLKGTNNRVPTGISIKPISGIIYQ